MMVYGVAMKVYGIDELLFLNIQSLLSPNIKIILKYEAAL